MDEVQAFAALPHAQQALRLRAWDDAAKVSELKVPDLPHYTAHLAACLQSQL